MTDTAHVKPLEEWTDRMIATNLECAVGNGRPPRNEVVYEACRRLRAPCGHRGGGGSVSTVVYEYERYRRDSPQLPCPMACGRMTDDPAGGPCEECWTEVRATSDTEDGTDG